MSRHLAGILVASLSALAACGGASGPPDTNSSAAAAGVPCDCVRAFWADSGMAGHFIPLGCLPGNDPVPLCTPQPTPWNVNPRLIP
jgi:hypothetical protein